MGDRVQIRELGGPALVLDSYVQVEPGERLLSDLVDELGTQLRDAPEALALPLGAISAHAARAQRVVVPDLGRTSLRDLLSSLDVVTIVTYGSDQAPAHERVAWLATHGAGKQAVLVLVADLRVPDGEDPPTGSGMGPESRSAFFEQLKSELLLSPPPGWDEARIGEHASYLDGKIAEAVTAESNSACPP